MKCPKCGCEDLQINESWDKTIDLPKKYKIWFWVGAVVIFFIAGGLAGVNFIAGIVGGVILIGYIGGGTNWYVQWKKEQKKKSHSKCICKRCGYTWYID